VALTGMFLTEGAFSEVSADPFFFEVFRFFGFEHRF